MDAGTSSHREYFALLATKDFEQVAILTQRLLAAGSILPTECKDCTPPLNKEKDVGLDTDADF
jgi:hypothetical protein